LRFDRGKVGRLRAAFGPPRAARLLDRGSVPHRTRRLTAPRPEDVVRWQRGVGSARV